jgi:hypothetical protein
MEQIKNVIKYFNKVSLSDLDKVKLMNRTDQKFCLHIAYLPAVIEAIQGHYSVLAIDGETIFNYDNTYYDTHDDQMFLSHQNGKLNRFKIRIRKYVQTGNHFLEVKFKNNKGRTIKERIERENFDPKFSYNELNFINNSTIYSGLQLEPKIKNSFNRFTLVDNDFTERVTIDIAPGFSNKEKEITLNNLIIIEIKQSKAAEPAMIVKVLREKKIREQGFSKYCIGRSLLEEKIKKNNFKPLLLKIRKEFYN